MLQCEVGSGNVVVAGQDSTCNTREKQDGRKKEQELEFH